MLFENRILGCAAHAGLVLLCVSALGCQDDPLGILAVEFGMVSPEEVVIPENANGEPVVDALLLATARGAVEIDVTGGMMTVELEGLPPLDQHEGGGYHYELWAMNDHGVEEHDPIGHHGGGDHGGGDEGDGDHGGGEHGGGDEGGGEHGGGDGGDGEHDDGACSLGHVEMEHVGRYHLMLAHRDVALDLDEVSGCMLTIVEEGEQGPGDHILLFGRLGVPVPGGDQAEPGEGSGGGHGGHGVAGR